MDKMRGLVDLLDKATAKDGAIIQTLHGIVEGQPLDVYSDRELLDVLDWLGALFTLRYGEQGCPEDGDTAVSDIIDSEIRFESQQEIIEERLYRYLTSHRYAFGSPVMRLA